MPPLLNSGGLGPTVILKLRDTELVVTAAVTLNVYTVVVPDLAGVPLKIPVVEPREIPPGKEPAETVNVIGEASPEVALTWVMLELRHPLGENVTKFPAGVVIFSDGYKTTLKMRVAEDPYVVDVHNTVNVYVEEVDTLDGVPLNWPVDVESVIPVGKVPLLMENVTGVESFIEATMEAIGV